MKTIKCGLFNKNTVTLFEDCNEITAYRWKEIQKYAYESAEIGSDITSFHKNFAKLFRFVGADKKQEAIQEMQNINRTVFLGITGISIKSYEFALFVHSINGKQCYDTSQSGLESIIKKLDNIQLKQSEVEDILTDLKKKLLLN